MSAPDDRGQRQEPANPTDLGRLNLLLDVLLKMAHGNDRNAVLGEFATQLSWVLDFDNCSFAFIEQADDAVVFQSASARNDLLEDDQQALLTAIEQRSPSRAESREGETSLALPLCVGERSVGAVLLKSRGPTAFDRNDVRCAQAAVAFLALAIDRLGRMKALAEAKDALQESNLELQQFAYVASHDLQAPLRAVTGFTQLLQQGYEDQLDKRAEQYMGNIVQGCERMKTMINDLLSYSRVDARTRPTELVDLDVVFDDTLLLLRADIDDATAKVTRDKLPMVKGDSAQLSHLFQNLIGNGLKYRGDSPPIVHVSAQRDHAAWTITVQDNGIGIDPKYHQQIFEIFRRLHSQEKFPGTGIGLAICRRIVLRHGGRIWLDSALGESTKFYFTIPAVDSEPRYWHPT